MIAIIVPTHIVPAHNEHAVISNCIESLLAAATQHGLNDEDVREISSLTVPAAT
jgi:hypothetical protein